MRVLVTGAAGFAGTWLCRQLVDEGCQVVAWVRSVPSSPIPGVQYRVQDVRDLVGCKASMRRDMPRQVYHLAALTNLADCEDNPQAAIDVNVQGTHNVFATMPQDAIGLLTSTSHVYGIPETLPIHEEHPVQPVGNYARSKWEAERAALTASDHVVVARAFHHTGPGQAPRYALAGWAKEISEGKAAIRVGDLSLRRDYTDVRDICRGYRILLERGDTGHVFNLCSGTAPTLQDMLSMLNGGLPPEIEKRNERVRRHDIPVMQGDPSQAEALGWKREISLAQTLEDLRGTFE